MRGGMMACPGHWRPPPSAFAPRESKMSLRTKMALIVFVATVIPFAMGGAAVQLVVAPAYKASVLRASEEHTQRLAEQVAWTIGMDASRLEKLAAWDEMRELAMRGLLTDAEASALEASWSRLPLSAEAVRPLLHNRVARELRWWRDTDDGVSEILATDGKGRLIAATGKTDDVLQADEHWWRAAQAGGTGRVFVSDVLRDAQTEMPTIDIAVPIYAEGAPGSAVLGVLKMSLDVPRMLGGVQQARLTEGAAAMLVDSRGRVLFRTSPSPPNGVNLAEAEHLQRFRSSTTGSYVLGTPSARLLTAWSKVQIQARPEGVRYRMPGLYVVTSRDASLAFGPLWNVQFWMLIIGLVTVAIAVAVGSWLADVLVVRQVRTLARGMRELARGDFERAADTAERLLSRREPATGRSDGTTPTLASSRD